MATDPKKNDEIRDEELENVAGGATSNYDEQLDSQNSADAGGSSTEQTLPSQRKAEI